MRTVLRVATAGFAAALSLIVVLSPGGYLSSVLAQAGGFLTTFDGVPAAPAPYSNPANWDIFVQGFTQNESGNTVSGGDSRGANIAQHGPNCEPPGYPYTAANSHIMRSEADTVFICNDHVMTSPGLTGYGAIYMTPPAVADFSAGATTITWDMSTLRTSARDWVDVVLTPWDQQSQMAYNNNDQHIPPHNIHVTMAGTNAMLGYERTNGGTQYNQGTDVQINGDGSTTWDQVFAAQNPALVESAARRDTFQITLTRTTISVCMPHYGYGGQPVFCWMRNAQLPQALDPAVWHDHAAVEFNHRVYNAEKACIDNQSPPPANPLDQFNIDHTGYGDSHCPNDTWHWDNVNIAPYLPFAISKSVPENFAQHSGGATTVNFQTASVAGSYLAFVQFGHTPDLRVSYNGGSTWQAPHIQPSIAPNNGASEENGEAVFDPMPAGVRSIMVRGSNGFWGTFEAQAFHLIGPPSGTASTSSTSTPVPTATNTPGSTPTSTPVPSSTPVSASPTVPPGAGGQSTIAFNDLANPNRVLTGAYPNPGVNWGSSAWWLSSAYDHFATNSVSFSGATLHSASISLPTPARLLHLDADNGGSASSTISLTCAGQSTVTTALAAHQLATIATNWTGTCSSVTLGSSNGWDTNFDNFTFASSGSTSATSTPTARATRVATATPPAGAHTVTFDSAAGSNVALNGQYPTAVVDWGTNHWLLAAPSHLLTTTSISFISAGPTSESFTFLTPRRLLQLDEFNDGPTASTISLSCPGQIARTVTLGGGQIATIATRWTATCSTITLSSTNGWRTRFDNLRYL
jgi:hypothetical protein